MRRVDSGLYCKKGSDELRPTLHKKSLRMRIAYLVSEYPATSHTFIRREVNALRARGIYVATFSVRRPAPSTISTARDQASFQETFYILPANLISIFLAHTLAFFGHPIRYLSV